ncbi:MAG: hypothetical protein AAF432_00975 [Planctomycetota bacterium]
MPFGIAPHVLFILALPWLASIAAMLFAKLHLQTMTRRCMLCEYDFSGRSASTTHCPECGVELRLPEHMYERKQLTPVGRRVSFVGMAIHQCYFIVILILIVSS